MNGTGEDPAPICQKCGKRVQGFVRGREYRRGNPCYFESECHGEKERVEYWPLKQAAALFIPEHAFPADRPAADSATYENPSSERNVLDFETELTSMPEWKRRTRIENFQISVRLLEGNAQELQTMLHYLTVDRRSWALSDLKRRAELDEVFEEVLRLLHNFVAAVKTLVDHSRVIYKELYATGNLFPDFQPEINRRFASSPLIQFVQELRELAQECWLPAIRYNSVFGLGPDGSHCRRSLVLLKSDLQRFNRWNAHAKAYLASAPEQIDLTEVVKAYVCEVRGFYLWMDARQREIHAPDFAAIEKVQTEACKVLAKEVPHLIESGLRTWGEKLGAFQDIFGFVFCPDDWMDLACHNDELVAWANAAIVLVEKRFGSLPTELASRIREAAHAAADARPLTGP